MMVAIEAGADDVIAEGDGFRIMTDPHLVYDVKTALDDAGIEVISADSPMVSDNLVPITDLRTPRRCCGSSRRSRTTTTCRTCSPTSTSATS